MAVSYEKLLDDRDGQSPFQLVVFVWMTISNVIHAGPVAFMVFGGMQPVKNGTNGSVFLFRSMAQEWDLTGERRSIAASVASMGLGGFCLGWIALGTFSDYLGRRKTVLLSLFAICLFTFAVAFSTGWKMAGAFLFFQGLSNGAFLHNKSVMYGELVVQKWRMFSFFIGPPLGFLLLDAFAYWVAYDWRQLALLMLTPVPIFVLLTLYPIQESPKWLIERHRCNEALKAFQTIARINSRQFKYTIDDIKETSTEHRQGSMIDLFRNRQLLLWTSVLAYSCFAASLIYYGMLFTLGNISGNLFLNFAIVYVIRMICNSAVVLLEVFVKRMGRRCMHQVAMVTSFLCCTTAAIAMAIPVLRDNYPVFSRIPAVVAVANSGLLFTVMQTLRIELLPTLVRSQAGGMIGSVGAIGSIAGPPFSLLFYVWKPLPFVILALLMGVNIVLAFFTLPETRGRPLPDFEKKTEALKLTQRT